MLEPVGESAYDSLLPRSIAYRPVPTTADGDINSTRTLMPLVQALKEGAETKEIGWHRNAERAARGLPPVENISNHMEPWEKQLVSTMQNALCFICFPFFVRKSPDSWNHLHTAFPTFATHRL